MLDLNLDDFLFYSEFRTGKWKFWMLFGRFLVSKLSNLVYREPQFVLSMHNMEDASLG